MTTDHATTHDRAHAGQHHGGTGHYYLIFLLLCVFGLREWQREFSSSVQAKPAENAANLLG